MLEHRQTCGDFSLCRSLFETAGDSIAQRVASDRRAGRGVDVVRLAIDHRRDHRLDGDAAAVGRFVVAVGVDRVTLTEKLPL